MDSFVHERNLELYRLQLTRTTNEDIRRQILRLIEEENKRHLPKAGLTVSSFSLNRRNGKRGIVNGSVADNK